MTSVEFCFCTHSRLAHNSSSGRCLGFLCKCTGFRLQARLFKGSPDPAIQDGELLVITASPLWENVDRLAATVLNLIRPQPDIKLFPTASGIEIHYHAYGRLNKASGRTIGDAFRQMLQEAISNLALQAFRHSHPETTPKKENARRKACG